MWRSLLESVALQCELWIINGNSCSKKNHSPCIIHREPRKYPFVSVSQRSLVYVVDLSAGHQFFWVRLSSKKSSKSYKIFLLFICSICSDLWNFCSKSTHFFFESDCRRRNLSNLFKSFTIINPCFIAAPYQGAQNVRFFRFVRCLPDRALHIPETKRIRKVAIQREQS